MPTLRELEEIRRNPRPAYPEYDQVRAEAKAMGLVIDPRELPVMNEVRRRRGYLWCSAVLGWLCDGVRDTSVTEARMLVIADRMGLDPPLPPKVTAWLEEDKRLRAAAEARVAAARQADRERWDAARADCQVAVEVRPNETAGRYSAGVREALCHAVPLADAVSGKGRLHAAGRALCETASRRPMRLGDATENPATCMRCLAWTLQVRPAKLKSDGRP